MYAAAFSVATGALGAEVVFQAGTITPEDINKAVWEDLNAVVASTYRRDPHISYDVTVQLAAPAGAAGTLSLTMLYTAGD